MVADSPIGSSLKLGILRDKKPITISVVVADRTKVFSQLYGGEPTEAKGPSDSVEMKFGMTVKPISPSEKTEMNLKNGSVVVDSVEPGSFASDMGLASGDVIVELNAHPVNSPADISRIQSTLKPGDAVAFHILRQARGSRGGTDWASLYPAGKVPDGNQ